MFPVRTPLGRRDLGTMFMFELQKDQIRQLTVSEIDSVGGGEDAKNTTTTTFTTMTIMTTSTPVCTTTTTTTTTTTLTTPWPDTNEV
jgi:hypothetical protein